MIQLYSRLVTSLTSNLTSIVNGIFLYTDEDEALANYIKKYINALDKLTGDWCNIYVLEKSEDLCDCDILWPILNLEAWKSYSSKELPKPSYRNESYNIARVLNVPFESFPCLVLLPPLKENKLDKVSFVSIKTKLLSKDKLIVPIKEVSAQYFRKMFSTLEKIVKSTEEKDKYKAIKINFNAMIQYLEDFNKNRAQNTVMKNGVADFADFGF